MLIINGKPAFTLREMQKIAAEKYNEYFFLTLLEILSNNIV